MTLNKYMIIKQYERSISEYIVERERLETTLEKIITNEIKETSFRKDLNRYMRDNMIVFRGLAYEKYVKEAEEVNQDIKKCKIDHYIIKSTLDSKTNPISLSKSNEKLGNKNFEKSSKK